MHRMTRLIRKGCNAWNLQRVPFSVVLKEAGVNFKQAVANSNCVTKRELKAGCLRQLIIL